MDVINSNVNINKRNLMTLGLRKSLLWNRRFHGTD